MGPIGQIASRLEALRGVMKKFGVDAYLIPSTDPHQNEYVPAFWQRRAYISGFTGSFGDLVVMRDRAGLFTDSRYFLQAESQLFGSGIELFRMGESGVPSLYPWIREELGGQGTLGIDPRLITLRSWSRILDTVGKRRVAMLEQNLVDLIWTDREAEAPTISPAEVWPLCHAGETVKSKLKRVRVAMAKEGADALVVTTLDALAWLFNIRGRDVPFNPIIIGYAVISMDDARLFVDERKATSELRSHLEGLAEIVYYDAFEAHLLDLAKDASRVMVDPDTVSRWVVDRLGAKRSMVRARNPIVGLKAVKNDTELSGMRRAHVRDGVAMVRFLSWLESEAALGSVTEISAAERLDAFRAQGEGYRGESFAAISAFGANGAVVHYDPRNGGRDVLLRPPGVYLIDSGAQYLDGTTDITRTVCLGEPTAEQRARFTQVLKGHIDLAMTAFPKGTFGTQLDTIARKPLWDAGANYGHGTGHGVGAYLCVHEGPHAISYYRGINVPLEIGMVVSNEPGYYKAGEFGVRIENLMCVARDDSRSSPGQEFLRLENLTLCPIDLRMIMEDLLADPEKEYLDRYHDTVRETLSPLLAEEERRWLEKATRSIRS